MLTLINRKRSRYINKKEMFQKNIYQFTEGSFTVNDSVTVTQTEAAEGRKGLFDVDFQVTVYH